MAAEEQRRLYRSRSEKIIGGVLGGMGEHWNVDPSIVRIIYAVFTLVTAVIPGVFLYLLMVLIIPPEPRKPKD